MTEKQWVFVEVLFDLYISLEGRPFRHHSYLVFRCAKRSRKLSDFMVQKWQCTLETRNN